MTPAPRTPPVAVLLPLALPIAAALTFTVVPSGARVPAFPAMIGIVAGIVLTARRRKAG